MKFRPNRQYTSIAIYAFLVLAAAVLFREAVQNFSTIADTAKLSITFIQPVIYGFIFAFLLNPMLRLYDNRLLPWLSRNRLKPTSRRVLGILLTYISIFVIIALFFRLVIPQLLLSIESLFNIVPRYMEQLNLLYSNILQQLENFQLLNQDDTIAVLLESLNNKLTSTLTQIIESSYEYVTGLIPQIFSAGARVTSSIINSLLGIIISIYILYDREKLFAQVNKIARALFSHRATTLMRDLCMDANRVFSGFIVGKIIDSAIIGVLCFIGMSLLHMPYAVLISVIVGVTNVIPYFGPFIGAIPSALILIIVDPLQSLWFLIFILLLQQFDGNILGPKILGDTTGLSALWVIFSIMLFSGLLGVLGMFIGVPLFALIYTVIRRIVNFLLRRKGLPENTKEYASDDNPLIS